MEEKPASVEALPVRIGLDMGETSFRGGGGGKQADVAEGGFNPGNSQIEVSLIAFDANEAAAYVDAGYGSCATTEKGVKNGVAGTCPALNMVKW